MRNILFLLALILDVAMTPGDTNNQAPYSGAAETGTIVFDILPTMQKSSVRIEYDLGESAESPVGASKIGGKPDLPPGFQ